MNVIKLKDTNDATPDNIESILAGALGRSKKPLPNEEEFYNTIISNNLISLIRNPHKFKKYIEHYCTSIILSMNLPLPSA